MTPADPTRSPGIANQPAIPRDMRALVLDGVGAEHLAVRSVPVPVAKSGQLLCRVDAAGICTSVNKLVEQGPDHPLMYGWDLSTFPVIAGDEGSVTVVAVGDALRTRYRPGERFAVQPAVDHEPIRDLSRYRDGGRSVNKIAVGYTLPGLLAEYVLIGEEVLAAGCLLPLPDDEIPAAHAAIAEPLSCVISSHAHHLRLAQADRTMRRTATSGIQPGSVVVIIGAGPMGRMHVDLSIAAQPSVLVVADVLDERLAALRRGFGDRAAARGVRLETVNAATEDLAATVDAVSEGRGADDVIVAVANADAVESAQRLLARYGVLNLFGGLPASRTDLALDGRLIHYREVNITGSSGGGPWDVIEALRLMACGEIDAGAHIAHIGDLAHAPRLLEMARTHLIDGKAVVYPHRRLDSIMNVRRWDGDDERRHLTTS